MGIGSTELSYKKQQELERALQDAGAEVVGRELAPQQLSHPLTGEAGYTPPDSGTLADANLGIVRHQDTGCVQLVFPVQGMLPLPQQTPAAPDDQIAVIRSRQLGPPSTQPWLLQAALHIGQDLTQQLASAIEGRHKAEGLVSMADGYATPATEAQLRPAAGQRVLLFVHGIFSSIEGAFSALAAPPVSADGTGAAALLPDLLARYQNRVFGYNHWTIAKTPQQNAADLLSRIPEGVNWDVDIVCHSRGGLLVRSLLADAVPPGVRLANPELADMARQREGKIRSVGQAIFVAAANQGSRLAEPDDVRNFLNVAALLASMTDCMALDVVIGLARWAVSAGFNLPSVQALGSGSTLVNDLLKTGSLLDHAQNSYARADFDYGASALFSSAVYIDRYLMQADNDLVVPYAGVTLPGDANVTDARMLSFGTPSEKQHQVWHTEFFKQYRMQQFLRGCLTAHQPTLAR